MQDLLVLIVCLMYLESEVSKACVSFSLSKSNMTFYWALTWTFYYLLHIFKNLLWCFLFHRWLSKSRLILETWKSCWGLCRKEPVCLSFCCLWVWHRVLFQLCSALVKSQNKWLIMLFHRKKDGQDVIIIFPFKKKERKSLKRSSLVWNLFTTDSPNLVSLVQQFVV